MPNAAKKSWLLRSSSSFMRSSFFNQRLTKKKCSRFETLCEWHIAQKHPWITISAIESILTPFSAPSNSEFRTSIMTIVAFAWNESLVIDSYGPDSLQWLAHRRHWDSLITVSSLTSNLPPQFDADDQSMIGRIPCSKSVFLKKLAIWQVNSSTWDPILPQ